VLFPYGEKRTYFQNPVEFSYTFESSNGLIDLFPERACTQLVGSLASHRAANFSFSFAAQLAAAMHAAALCFWGAGQPARAIDDLRKTANALFLPAAGAPCDDGPVTASYPFFLLACRVSSPFSIDRKANHEFVRDAF
jgi:hypothetical protein